MKQIILSDQETLKEEKINEFEKGLRPDNKRIGGYQSGEYAHLKNQINPFAGFGNVDLIYTGSFVSKLFVRPYYSRAFLFDSSDSKTGNLIGKYGLDIMGINKEWFNKRQKDIYRLTLSVELQKILNA